MKKVSLTGHISIKDKLIKHLQSLGLMQIIDLKDAVDPDDLEKVEPQKINLPADLETAFDKVTFSIRYLNQYAPDRKGLIESFMGQKIQVSQTEFERTIKEFDLNAVYETCHKDDAALSEIRNQRARLESEIALLEPWAPLDLALDEIKDTSKVSVTAATCPTEEVDGFVRSLEGLSAHCEVIYSTTRDSGILLYYLAQDREVLDRLRDHGISKVTLPARPQTPAQALSELKGNLEALAKREEEVAQRGEALAHEHRYNLYVLYDYLDNIRESYTVQDDFISTRSAFMLSGWVKELDIESLISNMSDFGNRLHIAVEDPSPSDSVPVSLENKPLIAPFEVVTNIYGAPSYREIDPTPLLAPFFFIFFGLALGDAAYGIALVILSLYFMKRYHPGEGGIKFFRLIMYGGISTILMGALMGSWFGNLLDLMPPWLGFLKQFKQALFLFDPMQQPLTMLAISLALGVIQIWFGIGVKMYANLKSGNTIDAVGDQLPWLVLIPAVICYALSGALNNEAVSRASSFAVLAAALGVIVGSSRNQKVFLLKPFTGLYGLYGGVGYLSDTLSYARLLALGLATSVIANVVNQIAMLTKDIPVLGYVLVPVIIIGGHTFNLLINVLGSFIHSGRLQFVEFFTKFFEGGGRRFNPFRIDTKYVEVIEPEARN